MDRMFNINDIKVFNPKELDGKVLKIMVVESEGIVLIAGQDIETKIIYLLNQTNK